MNKDYERCGSKSSYCSPWVGVSHGACVSLSGTISDVLQNKPCKCNVLGQPDYLLYSKGKYPLLFVPATFFIHPSWQYLVAALEKSVIFIDNKIFPLCSRVCILKSLYVL